MKFIPRNSAGFTLIELIVAFTIISILSVVGVASFVSYSRNQAVDNEANQLISILNLAKAKAQSQVKPEGCNTDLDPVVNEDLTEYRVIIEPIPNNRYRLAAFCAGSIINIPIEGSSNIYHVFPSPITVSANTYTISFKVISGIVTPSIIILTGKWAGTPDILRTITINIDGTIQ